MEVMMMRVTIRSKKKKDVDLKGKINNKNWTVLDGYSTVVELNNLFMTLKVVTKLSTDNPDKENFPGLVNTFGDPLSFHRVLMDIMSVMVYPDPPGTLLLNANPAFIVDSIPDGPFKLGYATASGGQDQTVRQIYEEKILQIYERNGLMLNKPSPKATFIAITSDQSKSIIREAGEIFPIGLDDDEVKTLVVGDKDHHQTKKNNFVSVGFVKDTDMEYRIRLSVLSVHAS
jgi:hypothetical protein